MYRGRSVASLETDVEGVCYRESDIRLVTNNSVRIVNPMTTEPRSPQPLTLSTLSSALIIMA